MSNVLKVAAVNAGVAAAETDANFNQTVLLLHGDGTNGAQNNTFLDGSTNNFTITRNGNTTQGTFSPFSLAAGEWSNYFDGNGDFLSASANSAFDITGDFTLEAWVYFVALPSQNASGGRVAAIAGYSNGSTANAGWECGVDFTGNVFFISSWGVSIAAGCSFTPNLNTWYHLAATKSSSTTRLFINGVSQTLTTNTLVINNGSSPTLNVGRASSNNGYLHYVPGYISNFRIVKGTAVYTSAFTPSTTPLTAITNTSLLTCQSNRFVDNSTNAFAITRNGDVRVTPFSPFAPSAAYDPAVNGGSMYSDGSGDNLSIAYDTALDVTQGDFTFEFWVYRTNSGVQLEVINQRGSLPGWLVRINSNNTIIGGYTGGGSAAIVTSIGTVPTNEWMHVAFARDGSSLRVFLNGVLDNTATGGNGTTSTATFYINRSYASSGSGVAGWLSDIRIVKGSAVYTSNFTPPTAPLTAITNTSLLCNFTNAGIFDNTGKNVLETVGNAQIDTTTKKYGTGSMEFDGTGDFLKVRKTAEFEFGSGDFTVEFWANANALSGAYTGVVGVWVAGSSVTANAWNITLNAFNGTNKFGFSYSNGSAGTDVIFNATTSTGSWDHYAVVRSGNTLYGFKNGVSQAISSGSSTITATITPGTVDLYIGTVGTASSGTDFNGFIDDLRITKGVARYTANFTPPTAAFEDQ
jgi:hypothetical protein